MSDTEISADVCVVGAGPAGLTLALLLLRSGLRVAVVERSRSFDREFRGEILQPGGQSLLGQLGVLDGAVRRGAVTHHRFRVVEGERVLLDADYRALPPPYNSLLSIPQRHILAELLDACRAQPGLTYLEGTRVSHLLRAGDRVTGVRALGPAGRHLVRALWTVGADGRYSKVRRLAEIGHVREDSFDQDVLWFKLPADGTPLTDVQVYRAGGRPALVYTSWPDRLQVGWTLPHGGYKELAAGGVEQVRAAIAAAVPRYADLVARHVTSFADLSLLDVFAAEATQWARDGLVLIGDAAHTHGPIGAQGINLAIQDAAALHPVLLEAVTGRDAGAAAVARYVALRQPAARKVMKLQRMQAAAMLGTNPFATRVRPKLAAAVRHTPVYRRILDRIAYGDRGIAVRTDLFPGFPGGIAEERRSA